VQVELIILFFIVAFVYSSVGFGGGSSYLAILAVWSLDYKMLRLMALICNIVVVSGGSYLYWKNGFLKWKKIGPLILLSIPAAFLGGYLRLTETTYFILLGITLFFAAIALWFKKQKQAIEIEETNSKPIGNSLIGGGIGFLSGLVGIGGGIFLSPTLHLMNWDKAKVISATASFFILVNSIAGIAGQLQHVNVADLDFTLIGGLVVAVFVGGQLGARIGIVKFDPTILRRLTAVLVLLVSIRLLYKNVYLLFN